MTFRVFSQKSAEWESPLKYYFIFHLVGNASSGVWTGALRLISQHTTRILPTRLWWLQWGLPKGISTNFNVPRSKHCLVVFKSTPNDRFFEKLFMEILLLTEFLPAICWEEITEEILFVFWCQAWSSNHGFTFNKPSHYLLEHGDFWGIS